MPATKPHHTGLSRSTLSADDLHQAIDRLADAINARRRSSPGQQKLVLLGIANGGIELARRLGARIKTAKVGTLDISFHRDDIGRHPIPKEYTPTLIPIDVNDAHVVLVDDVLFSGRTINAALNELFDHGRPARVELAILIDRGGRRLPIAADYTGITLDASDTDKVVVKLGPGNDTANDSVAIRPPANS